MTEQDISLITAAYSKEELARKYILAQNDVMRLEKENKDLNKEMYQWRIARPIGCPNCHRGCFSIDKYCGHCGKALNYKGGATMKFYFVSRDGKERRELNDEELHEHMSEYQIGEALEAKRNDPDEEVSYMTVGGYIVVGI